MGCYSLEGDIARARVQHGKVNGKRIFQDMLVQSSTTLRCITLDLPLDVDILEDAKHTRSAVNAERAFFTTTFSRTSACESQR